MKAEREQAWSLISKHRGQAHVFPGLTILKEQRSIVYKTINAIYTNIKHQMPDLRVCLPELSQEVLDILTGHSHIIQVQSIKLGGHHPIIKDLSQKHEQLIDDANRALRLCNTVLHHLDEVATDTVGTKSPG